MTSTQCWATAKNAKDTKALEGFSARKMSAGDPGFEDDPAYVACAHFLDLWHRRNYGHMHDSMAGLMGEGPATGPAELRRAFQKRDLEGFEILSLDFQAPAVCIATVRLVVDGVTYERPLRWLHEKPRRPVSSRRTARSVATHDVGCGLHPARAVGRVLGAKFGAARILVKPQLDET